MARVTIDDPPRMNLLGLILASILERNTEDDAKAARLAKMRGEVVVRSGEMAITITFAEGGTVVRRGASEKPNARLEGPLDALTDLALTRNLVRQFFRIKLRGNLFLLLKVWGLLRVSSRPALPAPVKD